MKLLDTLLEQAKKMGATDVHVGEGYRPFFRIDGEIFEQKNLPEGTQEDMEDLARFIFPSEQMEMLEIRVDIDVSCTHSSTGLRVRAHGYWERKRLNIAFRLLPLEIPSLEELGIPSAAQDRILELRDGLVLVSGPTGSGKSTTIASFLHAINREQRKHIITIEDPVEYAHENIRSLVKHREVGRGEGDVAQFPLALRSALREDPDVIFVGEMREVETMRLALRAAETGHLVFSTLHTSFVSQIPARIVSMFSSGEQERVQSQLAHVLRVAIAQRLLVKQEGGKVAAYEILVNNPAIRSLIIEGKSQGIRDTIKASRQEGMILMEDALAELEESNPAALLKIEEKAAYG
ncbi:MAG: PilT/PilU family type 4a pilus ATPase [Candidatus Yanofskybacteria bacterium]|nr:PilT/PilU family type 4a pilus ATPase [Candidatus Yanofskybacteria bacterium]